MALLPSFALTMRDQESTFHQSAIYLPARKAKDVNCVPILANPLENERTVRSEYIKKGKIMLNRIRSKKYQTEGIQGEISTSKDLTRALFDSGKLQQQGSPSKDKQNQIYESSYQSTKRPIGDAFLSLHKTDATSSEKRKVEDIEKGSNMQAEKREYTENNTLGLTKEEYVKRAGEAKKPEMFERLDQPNKKFEWDNALKAFLKKDGGTKALFLDFDGTMARFTNTPEQTLAVHGFLSTVKTFLDKGYRVAIITGRPINEEKGILAAIKRAGADDKLINELDIFGSHGVEHRGPDTKEEVIIRADVEKYTEMQKQLLKDLQQRIETNDELKGLGISFEPKASGATIHYRAVDVSKHQHVKDKLGTLLAKVLPEKSRNRDFSLLEDQNNEHGKKFMYNSATWAFEIHLNPATTDVKVNKGISVKSLVERWNVQDAIAFGDDTTDLDKLAALQELVADETSSLKTQAFVGTKHNTTRPEIITSSTIVVEGQESAVGLLKEMAERAEDQH